MKMENWAGTTRRGEKRIKTIKIRPSDNIDLNRIADAALSGEISAGRDREPSFDGDGVCFCSESRSHNDRKDKHETERNVR